MAIIANFLISTNPDDINCTEHDIEVDESGCDTALECNNQGICHPDGKCQCFLAFGGDNCSGMAVQKIYLEILLYNCPVSLGENFRVIVHSVVCV